MGSQFPPKALKLLRISKEFNFKLSETAFFLLNIIFMCKSNLEASKQNVNIHTYSMRTL